MVHWRTLALMATKTLLLVAMIGFLALTSMTAASFLILGGAVSEVCFGSGVDGQTLESSCETDVDWPFLIASLSVLLLSLLGLVLAIPALRKSVREDVQRLKANG